jgi:hypothetical protein
MSAGIAPIGERPAGRLGVRSMPMNPILGDRLNGSKMSRPLEAGRIRRCQRDSHPLGVS